MEDLINIATLYQNADSAQVAMAKEPMEDVQRTTDREPPPPSQIPSDDEDRRSDRSYNHEEKRISDYKKENKSRWNNQHSNIRPPSTRQGPPSQCGGCGAQGDRMHPRDHCPCAKPRMFPMWKNGSLQERMQELSKTTELVRQTQRCTPTILSATTLVSTSAVLLSLTENGPCQRNT